MPRLNFDGPPKFEVSNFQKAKFLAIQIPFGSGTKSLKLEGSYLGNWPAFYVLKGLHDESPQIHTQNSHFGGSGRIVILKGCETKG